MSGFEVATVRFTGGCVPRNEAQAEREVVRRVSEETGRHVEVMTGMTRRVPGGFEVTVAMGGSR